MILGCVGSLRERGREREGGRGFLIKGECMNEIIKKRNKMNILLKQIVYNR